MIHRTLWTVALAAIALAVPPARARAQDMTRDTTRDTTARVGQQFDGSKLTPIVLTYQTTVDTTHWGDRVVEVVHTMYAGLPAWLLVETYPGGVAGPSADSLTVDLLTLRPFHWGSTLRNPGLVSAGAYSRVEMDFEADSVRGVVSSPEGTRTVAMPMPSGTLGTMAMAEVAFGAVPLAMGWRDSTTILVSGAGTTRMFAGELEVIGQERLTVPAGMFDCWIVTLTTDVSQVTYWVAKREGFVVKTSQLLPDNAGLLTYTLTRVGR